MVYKFLQFPMQMYEACKIEMVSRAAATKYMPQRRVVSRSDPQKNGPLHTTNVQGSPFGKTSHFIFHHEQVRFCLLTVTFSLVSVLWASCKRHVVQVGREYLLEPSPCARSTPTTKSGASKLPCHGFKQIKTESC